jgi:hypothetical protein
VISHETFLNLIKPSRERLHELESQLSNKQLKLTEAERKAKKEEIEVIKERLKPFTTPFCTTESPIYNAIETGILILPENQGGSHKVSMKTFSN